MIKEIDILKYQYLGTVIFLIGSILEITITNKSIKFERLKELGVKLNPNLTDVSKETYIVSLLFLIAIIILTYTAYSRVENTKETAKIMSAEKVPTPEEKVATGFALATIGYILVAIGAYENTKNNNSQGTNF